MPTLDWLNRAEALTLSDKVPYRVLNPVAEYAHPLPQSLSREREREAEPPRPAGGERGERSGGRGVSSEEAHQGNLLIQPVTICYRLK